MCDGHRVVSGFDAVHVSVVALTIHEVRDRHNVSVDPRKVADDRRYIRGFQCDSTTVVINDGLSAHRARVGAVQPPDLTFFAKRMRTRQTCLRIKKAHGAAHRFFGGLTLSLL